MTTAQIILNALTALTATLDAALADDAAITTTAAKALANALAESGEDAAPDEIAWAVTADEAAEADAIANAATDVVDAVEAAIGRLNAGVDPTGVRTAIAAWRRLDQATSRLRLRLGRTFAGIRAETAARLKRLMEPTPRATVRAHALATEAAAEAAIGRPIKAELAASGWFAAGDLERGRLWLNRAKTRRWFATDFE